MHERTEATAGDEAGVLLINLGTPDAPTAPAVRRYLREFLSDVRVIDLPRLIWLPILYLLVLVFRPKKVARNYAKIWSDSGSPLLAGTRALAARMRVLQPGLPVAVGMRYGRPAIEAGLRELAAAGAPAPARRPPNSWWCARTAGTAAGRPRAALAESIRDWRAAHGAGEQLLMSFHGIPRRYAEAGDPYPQECERTAALLAEALGLGPGEWRMVYQSRFGKAEWLRPYADETLVELAAQGARRLDIVCPGFPVDCLETLEEVAIGFDEVFREAGGDALRYIPALNDSAAHARLLAELGRRSA